MDDDSQATWQDAHDSMQALYDQLNAQFDAAQNDDQRLAMDALADGASKALTQLNQEDMATRTGALQASGSDFKGAVDSLTKLKNELDKVCQGFAKGAEIVGDADKVIGDLTSFAGL